VFGEESSPGLERPVGGDAECSVFVGGGDEAEQQLGAGRARMKPSIWALYGPRTGAADPVRSGREVPARWPCLPEFGCDR
jgi:hypothetical protein